MNHPAFAAVEDLIRARQGTRFRIRSATAAHGGCMHSAFALTGDDEAYFVKIDAAERLPMFAAEADGLAAIGATATLRVPTVIGVERSGEHAYLVLERLELRALADATDGVRFAEALAALHRHGGEPFGWARDNFIGRTPQRNRESTNWAQFFVDCRLRPQLALALQNGFDGELQRAGARLCERVPALFLDYRPHASLVHGDLWHGNAAVLADGTPVVFDPAVHRGDRETDLVMSELFGGFPGAFYAAYRQAWPLQEDHPQRKPLYCLYHLLNHLNLFGRGYLRECMRLTEALNRELSLGRD